MDPFLGARWWVLTTALAASMFVPVAGAQTLSSEMKTVQTATYAEGSPQVAQWRSWLATQLSPTSPWFGDPSNLGQVTVTITTSRSPGSATSMDVPAPPAPGHPPIKGGADGDTYTVSSCSVRAGLLQAWTFTFDATTGAWPVTAYHGVNVKTCESGAREF